MVGMGATGGNFGTGLGAALSRWLGSGDYTVSANSITQKASAGTIPAMHQQGQSIVVRHKEFLTEVRGATTFTVRNEFDLNPGLSTTFPWLSGIASQYSQYKIRGLVYHYVPTSGSIATASPALGTVMIQTSYRATEAAPTSKLEMLNEYWSSEAKPSEEFCHPIECDPKENPFNVQYIRSGNLPSTENQLMYDLGRTTIAVSGQQANDQVLGDLWVTYEIELKKPVLTNANNADIFGYAMTASTGITNAAPFGSNAAERFNSFPGNFTVSSNAIYFPRGTVGTFLVNIYFQGATAAAGGAWTVTNGTALAAVAGVAAIFSDYTVGTGQAVWSSFVTISNPDLECNFAVGFTTLTAASRTRVTITEYNPACIVNL